MPILWTHIFQTHLNPLNLVKCTMKIGKKTPVQALFSLYVQRKIWIKKKQILLVSYRIDSRKETKKNWINKIKLNISNFGWVQNLNDDARDNIRDLENSIYTSSIHATFNYYMGVLLFLSLLFSLSYSLFVYLSFAPASVTFVC